MCPKAILSLGASPPAQQPGRGPIATTANESTPVAATSSALLTVENAIDFVSTPALHDRDLFTPNLSHFGVHETPSRATGRSIHRRRAAALLVFLPEAAGTRVVPPDLGSGGNQASFILIVVAPSSTDQSTSDSSRNT